MKCLDQRIVGIGLALAFSALPYSVGEARHVTEAPHAMQSAQTANDPSAKSAKVVFGALKAVLLVPKSKPEKSRWEEMLRRFGLAPWPEFDGGFTWSLEAVDGEVRAQNLFLDQETTVDVSFFPATRTPMSDATLSWMYRTAASYSFENGDEVLLYFPEEAITEGSGRLRYSFSLSLTSSTLTQTRVTMEWK